MRRKFDYYPSGHNARHVLFDHVYLSGSVAEPCVGSGDLLMGDEKWTNDLNRRRDATFHLDASLHSSWREFPPVDWVITNPPFNEAKEIACRAIEHARKGVALLLRLSFLEPVEERRDFLINHPPKKMIVMPRISFTRDGKTDNVTCAWFVWGDDVERGIEIGVF